MKPRIVCSKCREDFWTCKCDTYHPNLVLDASYKPEHLTPEELAVLAKMLRFQYVSYEDQAEQNAVNKLFRIVEKHELARRDNKGS